MRNKKRHSGQALIEFVFVLPLILLLVLGLFDLGRAVLFFSVLNTAVREGTRVAIVQDFKYFHANPDNLESVAYVDDTIDLSINPCSIGNCQAHDDICTAITDKFFFDAFFDSVIIIDHKDTESLDPRINIRIEYIYEPITPLIGPLIGNIPINVESEMLLAPVAQP